MAKTCLVTGASGGLGRAIAQAILERGDNLVAGAKNPDRRDDLRCRYPGSLLPVALDVANRGEAHAAVDAGIAAFAAIDMLVNNAGYGLAATFEQTSAESFEAQVATNLFGTAHMMRAVFQAHRARDLLLEHVNWMNERGMAPAFGNGCATSSTGSLNRRCETMCSSLLKDRVLSHRTADCRS